MSVRFSIIDFKKKDTRKGFFKSGHCNEGILDSIEELHELMKETSSLDVIPIKIVHYLYVGDKDDAGRDASQTELAKFQEDAYSMYRDGMIVVTGGYELSITGDKTEEIVAG